MAVSEMVFRYATKGAKAARRADEKVKQQVQDTAQTAKQQTGRVERWMTANRRAIQGLGLATAGAAGAVLNSSGRMQAELSGVRSAFGLLADSIVKQLLPNTGSLSRASLNIAQSFRDMGGAVKTVSSVLAGIGGVMAGIAAVVGSTASLIVGGFLSWAAIMSKVQQRFGALQNTISAWRSLGKSLAALLTGDFSKAWQLAQKAAGQFFTAAEKVWVGVWSIIIDGMNDIIGRAVGWGKSLINDFVGAISNRVSNARSAAASIRDRIVNRLSTIANSASEWGRSIVNGIINGLKNRLGALKNAASDVAQAIRDRLPSSPAKTGPLSDLDKVRGAIPRTLQEGLNEGVGNVTGTLNTAPRGGASGGGRTVNVETVEIVIQGSGNPRRDGRNAAEEVAEQFERNLGGRGV